MTSTATGMGQAPDAAVTRGAPAPGACLFVELRGLAELIRSSGTMTAAGALLRFNERVMQAVARASGGQVRTEGLSVYVEFDSADSAVACGLAIVGEIATDGPAAAPTVAVGVAGGGGLQAADGYLRSSSASSAAGPSEVVVTDELRKQVHRPGIRFDRARSSATDGGRDAGRLWLAVPHEAVAVRPLQRRQVQFGALAVVLVVLVLIAAVVVWPRIQPAAALTSGPWTIGAQLPLSGDAAAFGADLLNGVTLAIDDANAAGGAGGAPIRLDVRDEGSGPSADLAASSIQPLVAEDRVIGVVGPAFSTTAQVDIPITNPAGLLQCSPSTTRSGLTKPRYGALDLRSARPDQVNFVRLIPSDDIQGPAAAALVYNTPSTDNVAMGIKGNAGLGVHHALVIDDTSIGGRNVADSFEGAFEAKGGTVERRAHNPDAADFDAILGSLENSSNPAGAVYYGGDAEGVLELKGALSAAGDGALPVVNWDAVFDGSGADNGSFIQLAGPLAVPTYATQPSIGPVQADFGARYRERFGADPNDYSAAAYACTQVIVAALRGATQAGADAAGMREAVRAYAVDTSKRTQTVIGSIGFDTNGDSLDQFVTFYDVDAGAAGGQGDWVYLDQQNFGPAP